MLRFAIFVTLLVLLFEYSPRLAGSVVLAALFLAAFGGRLQRPRSTSRAQVAAVLREFLEDPFSAVHDVDGSFWDDFILHRIRDARLDEIRSRCATLERDFPSERASRVCSDEGERLVREFLTELEAGDGPV